MAFLKAAWSFIRGVKDALVLLFLLLFFGALYAALSFSSGERADSSGPGALLLDLDGVIVEQPHDEDPWTALSSTAPGVQEYRLRDLLVALKSAETDSKVKAVALDLDGFLGGGQVALAQVGQALDAVRKAGKPVYAYATAYQDDGYLLAAHASEVWLNPIGGVAVQGPGGSQLYFKGLIDKLGITANIYRVGTFKSAVEPFLRSDQSPEARAANEALAGALWSNWQDNVTRARPRAKLAAYVQNTEAQVRAARGNLSQTALSAGLVDKLGDATQFAAHVAKQAGEDSATDGPGFATVDLASYVRAHAPKAAGNVGVVTIAGEIVDGEAGAGTAGGDSVSDMIRKALAENDYKALVVRIDSPGGSVLASEKIRAAILAAKTQGMPVVASMGDVAASGGYWVATPADKILAEPSTITGSIGVFGILPSFEGTLAKAGITTDGVRTTPLSGEPNVLGGVSEEFNALAQLSVEDMYRRFIGLVAASRKLSPARVDSIAQGRVWDGGTARQLGLVDQFGSLDDAIALAGKLAKLEPDAVRASYIEPEPDAFTALARMLESESEDARAAAPVDLLGKQAWVQQQLALRAVQQVRWLAGSPGMQAACLECAGYRATAIRADTSAGGWWSWIVAKLMG